jgi:2-methylcitrate dehydratase PrpD
MTAAEQIGAWTASLRLEAIPPHVQLAAKLHLLDTLGCGIAASALGIATAGRRIGREAGGSPQASVIGAPPMPAAPAALANAMLCHGLDYDDTHTDSVCHVSTVVGPTALAAAEAAGAGGDELLVALVVGSEIITRVGMATPAAFHRRGFHPTSVCGVLGAAAAAARLRGLDAGRIVRALGIAGSLAGGIFEYLADGSETKPIHAANAAHGGIVAAGLAAHGATGPASVLEGRFGLFAAFADVHGIDLEPVFADLGERWETPRIAYKPYPACHFIHAPLDAAIEALGGQHVDPQDIEEIVVRVPEPGVALVLEPAADKVAPRTSYDAKFSLPYSIAALLVHGRVDLDSYRPETIGDPLVIALARRVRYQVEAFPTFPKAFPGAASIRLRNGRRLEAVLPHQRGGPENPMSDDQVIAKFRANARLGLGADAAQTLETAILAIEDRPDLGQALVALGAVESL